MKVKKLLSVLGLGLFAAVSVGAGVALNKGAKAETVKADGEKWMVTICFDNTIPETSESWGYIENQKVNFWGTNVTYEGSVQSFHPTGRDHFYAVNVVFTSEQLVSGMQLNFTENGVKKESQNISIELDSSCNGRVYTFEFPEEVTWVDGKWSASKIGGAFEPIGNFGGVQKDFLPDPETASYYCKDVIVDTSSTFYVEFKPFTSSHTWNDTFAIVRNEASYWVDYFDKNHGDHYVEMDVDGTYDLFITNEFKEGGVLDVKKHIEPSETYIYYVLENATPTNDYIYSWGGSEQFGSWPGTKITEVEHVEEVTGNGVLHFQGGETAKLIYKIPVKTGYPDGDSEFKFNNNDTMETAARPISGHNAYWWEGDANSQAGYSIDFLKSVEDARNAVTPSGDIKEYSVCGISKSDAEHFVNTYQSLGVYMQETYIDCTTVYTYKKDGSEGNELVSYKDVICELAKKAEIELEGSPRSISSPVAGLTGVDSTTLIAIISVICLVSISSIVVLIVVKKRKHE